jgi:hypothetical protein
MVGSLDTFHRAAHVRQGELVAEKQFGACLFEAPRPMIVAPYESSHGISLFEELQGGLQAGFAGGACDENLRFDGHLGFSPE